MIRTVLVAVCLLATAGCSLHRGGAAVPPQPEASKIRVFVFTQPRPTPNPDGDQIRREQTTALVTEYLGDKKSLTLVDTRERADVIVEVLSAASALKPQLPAPFDPNAVPVNVTAAGQTARLTQSQRGLDRAAYEVAQDIERWIKANKAKIVAARPPAK
jgi:hypothetical protein